MTGIRERFARTRIASRAVWLWLLIAEPRVARALQGMVYLSMALAGALALIVRPDAIEGAIGAALTIIFGAFLLLGGLSGCVGVLSGFLFVELAGVVSAFFGVVIYFVIMVAVALGAPGLLVQMAVILTLLFTLVKRWHEIRSEIRRIKRDAERGE